MSPGGGLGAARRTRRRSRPSRCATSSTRTGTGITRTATRSTAPTSRSSATSTRGSEAGRRRFDPRPQLGPVHRRPARPHRRTARTGHGGDGRRRSAEARRRSWPCSRPSETARPRSPSCRRRVTVNDHLTLFRGGREIRLLFSAAPTPAATSSCSCRRSGRHHRRPAGRGHVVHRRRLHRRLAADARAAARARLRRRRCPATAAPSRGKAKIDHFQAYLRDFWPQAQALHTAGVPRRGRRQAHRHADARRQLPGHHRARGAVARRGPGLRRARRPGAVATPRRVGQRGRLSGPRIDPPPGFVIS